MPSNYIYTAERSRFDTSLWRHLENKVKQISKLNGMKRMGNFFRTPVGDGWALVGDAYHRKDSLDAQSIYDALIGAKYLFDMRHLKDDYRNAKQTGTATEANATTTRPYSPPTKQTHHNETAA